MIRYLYLFIFIFLLLIYRASAQTDKRTDVSAVLEDLYDRITKTKDDDGKLRLNDSIRLIIGDYALSDSVFSHTFSNLRYLGQIISPDNKLKIITWNVFLREGPNRYFSYIIRKGEKKKPGRVYILSGINREDPVNTEITYKADNWYGALYYAIQPFKKERKVYYILLGLDYGNLKVSRKIIDVLSFEADGTLLLGLDCFVRDRHTESRVVLSYSPDGVVILRFADRKTIVFDQIEDITTGHGNGSGLSVPGSSYNGYVFRKGSWRFVSGIDVKNTKTN